MSKVLVFDIDDTISVHTNRDYVNAKPVQPVIDKLNRLHDEGYYIKLFTGRGQVSCNGDLNLIIERNKDVLETWLEKHGVKIHGAMQSAYPSLYGYRSDKSGIRHNSGIDENTTFEEAKYMLVSCSAFLNYLVQIYDSLKQK